MQYSHSYEDPDTGQMIDVMVADPGDLPRNATLGAPMDAMRRGRRGVRQHPSSRGGTRGDGDRVLSGPGWRPAPRPMSAPWQLQQPWQAEQTRPGFVTLKTADLAGLIPSIGKVWASFLGRPAVPNAVGDDVIDRDNAAAHRDALAKHQQSQTRILALTDLAERALRMLA